MRVHPSVFACCFMLPFVLSSCSEQDQTPSKALISSLQLKRGSLISCGPALNKFGSVQFSISGNKKSKEAFELGLKLLHSFEYDEAEKVFSTIIDEQPDCAMAYWGVAMSNFHPLWTPPTPAELEKGAKAIGIAQSLKNKTSREADYINALAAFYANRDKEDHLTRCLAFEAAMEHLHHQYPDDHDAAALYALALDAAADPNDKTFQKQKKAGAILNALYPGEPDHPGIAHYLIHTFDSPELAEQGLAAARKYASIAPSSSHALHMPSHIFTRLGLWDECITSNLASMNSSQCYAQQAGIKGHMDEELHALDYLIYAYLQKGDNVQAKKLVDYTADMKEIYPVNFKVAYAVSAIPCRYVLENRQWAAAAILQPTNPGIDWNKYPWQKATIHFTRLMGLVHTGKMEQAKTELQSLRQAYDTLVLQKDKYKIDKVLILINTGEAWIDVKEKKRNEALRLMTAAADKEDNTEKHPVTPGELLPARELLGDMLMEMDQPSLALEAYEANLKKHPNRFNGLYGATLAAKRSGHATKATQYFQQLREIKKGTSSTRPELQN
ncbi:MAG: hypothetical protein J7578_07130 [Chitinophagaceae bacterium]|nr:hypothetical protein [Chitinophagaceae bacterium]